MATLLNPQDVDLSGGTQVAAGAYLDPGDPLLQQLDRRAVQDQCSPSPVIAVIYFCSFVLLCGLILVNFVIGVIIDNMQSSTESEELPVSRHHLMQYQQVRGSWGWGGPVVVCAACCCWLKPGKICKLVHVRQCFANEPVYLANTCPLVVHLQPCRPGQNWTLKPPTTSQQCSSAP